MFWEKFQHRMGKTALIFAMVGVLAFVWSPVLENEFLTNWDDQWMVLENPHLLEVTFFNEVRGETVSAIVTEPYNGQYSPLNTLAYMGIIKVAGQEAFAFHLFNLLVHLANFFLVGFVIQKLLHLIPDLHVTRKVITGIAWITAFLFAIHPLQVEPVAWISASKIVLYSFFYLSGMWFYLLYKQSNRWLYLAIVFLCFLASLFSKEQAVVFAATLVLLDTVIYKDLRQKKIWIEKIPFVVVAILFGWFTLSIQSSLNVGGNYPLGQRFLFANYSFWEYIVKLIVPYNLSYFYFFPMDSGEAIPVRLWFYPLATGVFLLVLYEYQHKINRIIFFGGLFFLINIVLVLHLLPTPRAAIIADRYVYLSAIGFFFLVVYGAYSFFMWLSQRNIIRMGLMIGGIVYLLGLAGYTHLRIFAWHDSQTLYQDVETVVERYTGGSGIEIEQAIPSACIDE